MPDATGDYLRSLKGVIPAEHILGLKGVFAAALSGEIDGKKLLSDLDNIAAEVSGAPDPRHELRLMQEWASAPATLARRCYMDDGAP